MSYCPECGKRVAATAKFCRNCGASQLEELPSNPPGAVPPSGTHPCASSGNPPGPDEKFCGACGANEGEPVPQSSSYASPAPSQSPQLPPVPESPLSHSCTACGLALSPGTRFCGVCGTTVIELPVAAPAPLAEPVTSPPPPLSYTPPPAPSLAQTQRSRLCRSCGYIINPGDRFCKKCLAKVEEGRAISGVSYEVPVPVVSPPPPEGQSVSATVSSQPKNRLCRSCGYIINPGDRFCKKCLAKVAEVFPASPAPASTHSTQVPPLPVSFPVCTSCGSPITGTEKFCGICGTATRSVAPPPPSSFPLEKMTCPRCGAPVSATTKFCGECGSAVEATLTPGTIAPAPAADFIPPHVMTSPSSPVSEEVTGVIGNARKMKMFGAGWDTCTIVVTTRRMIVAQMTQALLNAAIMEVQSKAKAEGKGLFAIMKDQMAAQFRFALRYETMSPDTSLAETAGNFALENTRISAITMKLKDSGSGDMEYTEFLMIIESAGGKFEYLIAEDDRFINLLKTVYGEKVHMPFGYFRTGGVRVKFF